MNKTHFADRLTHCLDFLTHILDQELYSNFHITSNYYLEGERPAAVRLIVVMQVGGDVQLVEDYGRREHHAICHRRRR